MKNSEMIDLYNQLYILIDTDPEYDSMQEALNMLISDIAMRYKKATGENIQDAMGWVTKEQRGRNNV